MLVQIIQCYQKGVSYKLNALTAKYYYSLVFLTIILKMQQRKYITVQRSANKETQRPSYQPIPYRQTYDTNFYGDLNRYGSNSNLIQSRVSREEPKMKYSQLHKSPSESNFKSRQQYVKGNLARRRGDGMVSNLKSELQNLKMEVSKLMSKESDNRQSNFRRASLKADEDEVESESAISLGNYGKQISDTISVTSQKIIDEPLRRIQSKLSSGNYDHAHYLELQNDYLKTELRNLKNKYNATKQDLKEKCQALERKNEYLEVSLRRSQEALSQCKKGLEIELQTIKFQLNRKLQEQYEQEQRRSERSMHPVRDNLGQNQLVQQKLNKLYQQLGEKSKIISSMNIQLNELKGQIEKKNFQLRKETQKNSQFGKQLQFSKRQSARNKNSLQQELSKKVQLTKTVETLREKINELTKQLNLQKQIEKGSEELESKYSTQLQQYRQNDERLTQQNFELKNQVRKLKQLIESHEQEIRHLKNTIGDFTTQIQQISKSLRLEREKAIENEDNYRRLLDQTKDNYQKQMESIQLQYDRYRESAKQIVYNNQIEEVRSKQNYDIKEKQRIISKWKAEFKMLKIKYEEHMQSENIKKQEMETYYRNYKQYKSKNKILEMKNKVLEESANSFIEKLQNLQTANLEQRSHSMQKFNDFSLENQQLTRKITYLEQELAELRNALQSEIERANSQQSMRREIQKKVLNIDFDNNNSNVEEGNEFEQIIEKIKKRIGDQDQKTNKYIKQMKNKDSLIKQLKKQIRNVLENQQNQLQKFRNKQIFDCLEDIRNKNSAALELIKFQYQKQLNIQVANNKELIEENSKIKSEVTQLLANLHELKDEVKCVSHLYNVKTMQLQQVLQKNEMEKSLSFNKFEELQKIKNHTIKSLQAEIAAKNEQIMNNRAQIKKYLTITKSGAEEEKFDEALRVQIEGAKKLRQQLNKKNQEVYRLRDSFSALKAQLDNLKSESDIAKLKFFSQKKNLQVQFEVDSQKLKNQLWSEQKKTNSLQQKIKLVIDQNKKKDNFIQSYIMGKKLPTNEREIVSAFLKQYEICVTGKNISQKLQSQSQQLEKMASYNLNLMKQIAEMKEKMLLYEATSVQNSQLRDSHVSDVDAVPKNNLMKSQSIAGVRNFD